MRGNIESQLTIIDNIANQILFDNDIWRYLHSSTAEPDCFVIKRVLQKIGNLNVQSFIRYFKKYHGLTPEQYRKNPESA